MMIKALTFLLFPLLFHPVHVTMSSLTLLQQEESFEMVVRLYSDDLAIDLWRLYQPADSLFADHRFYGPDLYYQRYVNDNLLVEVNGRVLSAELVEVEKLEIETLIRLIVPVRKKVRSVSVENRFLTDLFSDQVNLFIYKDDVNEKSVRFTVENTNEALVGE
ncbi:MAG: hypothetical protein E4G95_08895 [Bacteroidia bacterium]|nr:MAG: hypothetical protein E4G95_08895 [Bacteroidia bacterium]